MPPAPPPVLVVGEVLWDALPDGLFLGGAPANVAVHLARLGVGAALASRVGDDALGREAVRRLAEASVSTELVQTDPALPTGLVAVEVDAEGAARYEILRPAAWDALAATDALLAAATGTPGQAAGSPGQAAGARALVYGTLAQRDARSRQALAAVRAAAPGALHVCDVNLRPPHASPATAEASLRGADLVKLNDEELATLAGWFDLLAAPEGALRALAERFGLATVCVTRGAGGAALLHGGELHERPGVAVRVADTVGAGDAFLAALLAALLGGAGPAAALDRANRLGAFVAGHRGATPPYGLADVFG